MISPKRAHGLRHGTERYVIITFIQKTSVEEIFAKAQVRAWESGYCMPLAIKAFLRPLSKPCFHLHELKHNGEQSHGRFHKSFLNQSEPHI